MPGRGIQSNSSEHVAKKKEPKTMRNRREGGKLMSLDLKKQDREFFFILFFSEIWQTLTEKEKTIKLLYP